MPGNHQPENAACRGLREVRPEPVASQSGVRPHVFASSFADVPEADQCMVLIIKGIFPLSGHEIGKLVCMQGRVRPSFPG